MKFIYLLLTTCLLTGTLHAQKTDPATGDYILNEPGERDSEKVYSIVEQQSVREGGFAAMAEYLKTNTHYPLNEVLEGSVYVMFVVTKTGDVKYAKVIKGMGPAFDEEALRVIKESGPWTPGKQNGEVVHSRMVIPVSFKKKSS